MTIRRTIQWVGALVVVVGLGGCQDFTQGPALSVEVPPSSLALTPTGTSDLECCCKVTGRVVNHSTVPVHATLRFDAFAASGPEPIATAIDFLADIQPNEDRPIEASGILMPCSAIDRFELVDIDLRGIWFP